jgi:hypothetical protein
MLELVSDGDPPISASQVAGMTSSPSTKSLDFLERSEQKHAKLYFGTFSLIILGFGEGTPLLNVFLLFKSYIFQSTDQKLLLQHVP